MTQHPAIVSGRVAVVTGAASGIGLAAAKRFASLGLRVVMADVDETALESAAASVAGQTEILAVPTDVSRREEVEALALRAYERFGDVAVLMNNAGREGGGQLFGDPDRWRQLIETNLWGVIHGIQVFVPRMLEEDRLGAVISTGSKQGITSPPGDTAYNVTKAGVKVVTEALAHELRNIEGCKVTAHLLIPGFTFTGFTKVKHDTKPDAAWMPGQVIDELLARMARGDFYILCPDNDVTREMDRKRIRWAAEDIVQNRPALSRWHKDYEQAFKQWMEG